MKNTKKNNKPTLVCFLLDRSGSMASCKDETISGFNAYIKELKTKDKNTIFTLTQFDSIGVDVIYDAVPLNKVKELSFEPRGNTPLYDAIGKTIRATEKLEDKYKILLVTLTDGVENASSDWNLESVKNLIKEKEDKNKWTFAHIGVGLNGWNQMHTLSIGTQSAYNVLNIDPKDTKKAYRQFATSTVSYMSNNNGSTVQTDFWQSKD